MANWKYKLNLNDLKESYEADKISIGELGKQISKRIELLSCFKADDELQEISDNFNYLEDEDDFNDVLESLYDWGDSTTKPSRGTMRNRMCWVGFAF